MVKLAIFASGNGTNAQRIIEYFRGHDSISVELVLSNNPAAHVLKRAADLKVPFEVVSQEEFPSSRKVLDILEEYKIDFIVLAGFLLKIPGYLLSRYPDKIVNIHPALLPKYGGKGMYGMSVHKAVLGSGDAESGISIHFVNEKYDDGAIIFQAECEVSPSDTPESLAEKVHALEHEYYPVVIEALAVEEIEED